MSGPTWSSPPDRGAATRRSRPTSAPTGGEAVTVVADVSDLEDALDGLVDQTAVEAFGGIDIVVNNAEGGLVPAGVHGHPQRPEPSRSRRSRFNVTTAFRK